MPERIAYIALGDLHPHPENPKAHDLDAVGASIRRFGFVTPLVQNEADGLLLEGHGRLDALLAMQAAGEAPPDGVRTSRGAWLVPVVTGVALDPDAERAYLIASNRTVELGGWDDARLSALLTSLASDGGMVGTGYTEGDLARIIASLAPVPGLADPDDAPPLPAKPYVKRGQVYELGVHRLMCGDATSASDHETLLNGAVIDLVITDPPYGVGIAYESFEDTIENVVALVAAFMPLVRHWPVVLVTSGVVAMWAYPKPTWVLAWVHPAGSGTGPWGFTTFNPVLAFGRDPYLASGRGRHPDSIVMATDRKGVDGHPVVKPIELWEWLVERGSVNAGDAILDPFAGSGTSIIAAERLGRRCYAMDIEPRYVQVAIERWQNYTGQKARRIDG